MGGYKGDRLLCRDAKSFPLVQLSQHQPAPRGTDTLLAKAGPFSSAHCGSGIMHLGREKPAAKQQLGERSKCVTATALQTLRPGEKEYQGQRRDPFAALGGPQESRDPGAAHGVMP